MAALAVAALAVGLLVPVAKGDPAPGYEQFAGCPTKAEVPGVTLCQRSVITGGHFKMGSKNVPISKPIVLTSGFESSTNLLYWNSEGGLSPTKLEVPGGLIGLTGLDWLIKLLNADELKVYAETQTAGTPELTGTKLTLPIKVRLINPALGNNCYVGSDAAPIVLNLTTGTTSPPPPNEPITGKAPTTKFDIKTGIISSKEGTYVDNSFAAPGAKGCILLGFSPLPLPIDSLVNFQSGLPSPAGTNETVQNFEAEQVVRTRVYPGE